MNEIYLYFVNKQLFSWALLGLQQANGFTTAGSLGDQHKGHSGRRRTGRSTENMGVVRNCVVGSPGNQWNNFL